MRLQYIERLETLTMSYDKRVMPKINIWPVTELMVSYDRLPMYAHNFSQSASSSRLRSPSSAYRPFFGPIRPRDHSPHKAHRSTYIKSKKARLKALVKYLLFAPIFLIALGLWLYEPHIELSFYNRNWIQREIHAVEPLAGCFNPSRISPTYNLSEAVYGPKQTEVQAGMSLRMGLDCYDLAGTIQSHRPYEHAPYYVPAEQRTQYHTYWRDDLAEFGERQDWMVKSFFATQDLRRSRLILWSNGDLSNHPILHIYLRKYPDSFVLKKVDKERLARGTELDGSPRLSVLDDKAWTDGDLIRLLVLWNYGGVWVDMDTLLTRDLEPLLEHEFVTQWDCYGAFMLVVFILSVRNSLLLDKPYSPFNGALMRFRQHSPYLCEAFHIMHTSAPPRRGSTDWGSLLYFKLYRRLIASSIPPFKILPFCFSDARSCRLDNRLPDPFEPDNANGKWTMGLGLEEGGALDQVLGKVFGVHLHNQWEKAFPENGWVRRLLLNRYEQKLARAGYAQHSYLE